jgi:general secretion pathway protein C
MKIRISTFLPLLLITLACVLAVEGVYTVVEKNLRAPVQKAAVVAQVPERKQLEATSAQRTAEENVRKVLQRNLFGPPPSTAAVKPAGDQSAADLQPTSLSLVLMGTIVSAGAESRAIVLEKDTKNQDIYQQGDVVQGAVVKEILRKKIVLTSNGSDEILDMTEAAKYTPMPPSPAAVAPAARRNQALPGMEPQNLESAQPSPPGGRPRIIRPNRRTYTPIPSQPSQ